MGYAGKLKEKALAIKLRKTGLSYSEIRKKVPVSKGTLSIWCRDMALTKEQMERLKRKSLKGAEKGRFIGSKRQQRRRLARTKQLLNQGRKEVGRLNKRERFTTGIGLYLGDGYKGDKEVGFSNTNPKVIKFMMRWFRDFCNIPENKFRGRIWIHDNLNELKARKYWSKITGIPISHFFKSYISKNKRDSKKIRKNIHELGVFTVKASHSEAQRRILGWFFGVLGETL